MSDIEPFSANNTTLVSGLADKLNETIEVVNEIDFSNIEITGGTISNTNITAFGTSESGNSSPLTITNNSNSATFGLDDSGTLVINNDNNGLRIGGNNVLTDAGGTLSGGLGFGNSSASSSTDLSRHINLFNGSFGFSISPNTLNHVSGGVHDFYRGGTLILRASTTQFQYLGNNIFHEGNDGSGSGLDADLLDGQQGSYYTNITARLGYTPLNSAGGTISGNLDTRTIRITSTANGSLSSTTHGFQIGSSSNANLIMDTNELQARSNGTSATLFLNPLGGDVRVNGQTVWHRGNDGSGSGLDADLLDGQQGSYYTNITARLGYTPLNSAGGTLSGGLGFGNSSASSSTDLSRHINLFNGSFGFSISPNTLNHVSGGVHDFYSNTTLRARITASTVDFFVGTLTLRNTTNGYTILASSSPNHTGHLEFREPNETRAGFIGFGASGGPILIQAENASHYQFNRTPRVDSDDIVHGGNFYDFSGRYGSRITHISTSTIDLNDIGGIIEVTNANVIIPNDSTVNFPIGTKLDFYNLGTGVSSIQPETGVFLRSADNKRTFRVRYSAATALKRGTNDWVLIGDLV